LFADVTREQHARERDHDPCPLRFASSFVSLVTLFLAFFALFALFVFFVFFVVQSSACIV